MKLVFRFYMKLLFGVDLDEKQDPCQNVLNYNQIFCFKGNMQEYFIEDGDIYEVS
jgi:hypothetical protein